MLITWEILKDKTLEDAENLYRSGLVSENHWIQYCYLWRNSCYRYSNELKDYEITR